MGLTLRPWIWLKSSRPSLAEVIDEARNIATIAHEGQLYGTGEPYIVHPTQVARMAEKLGYGSEVRAACFLHDVLEDTSITEVSLRDTFSAAIVDAVVAVTYLSSNYDEKIAQAMAHPIGRVVKFCDVSCNFSNAVLHGVKEGQRFDEVILRRAGYIAKLKNDLPSPREIEHFLNR